MHTNKILNYFFERMWNSTFIYFTYWGLVIQFLYYIGVLKSYQESVLVIVITVSIIGAILTYIYPRKIVTRNLKIEFTDTKLQLIDLFAHQLPLILFLCVYDPKIKPDNLLFATGALFIYVLIYNPIDVYNFKCDKKKYYNNIQSNNKIIKNNIFRYHLATGLMLIYFIVLVLAINIGIFK